MLSLLSHEVACAFFSQKPEVEVETLRMAFPTWFCLLFAQRVSRAHALNSITMQMHEQARSAILLKCLFFLNRRHVTLFVDVTSQKLYTSRVCNHIPQTTETTHLCNHILPTVETTHPCNHTPPSAETTHLCKRSSGQEGPQQAPALWI